LVSLASMEIIGDKIVTPGEDFEEPIALLVASLVFALLANAAYTLGWVLECKMIKGSTQDHQAFPKEVLPSRFLPILCASHVTHVDRGTFMGTP
jgi:hypothetical protein